MSRLSATLVHDVRLQARNKVYLVIGVVTCGTAFALGALFDPEQLRFFMPILVLGGTTATTVFLVGLLLQLERGEGTLDPVNVSPLRPLEYLGSKWLTLMALAIVESALIAGIAFGSGISVAWLLIAVILRASLGVAVGIAVGVRYRSMIRFLAPAILASVAFDLPNIWYLELWSTPLFYLLPTMPSLLLAKAAFLPIEPLQIAYAVVYGTLAVGAAMLWASRSMNRFVVRGEPAR